MLPLVLRPEGASWDAHDGGSKAGSNAGMSVKRPAGCISKSSRTPGCSVPGAAARTGPVRERRKV